MRIFYSKMWLLFFAGLEIQAAGTSNIACLKVARPIMLMAGYDVKSELTQDQLLKLIGKLKSLRSTIAKSNSQDPRLGPLDAGLSGLTKAGLNWDGFRRCGCNTGSSEWVESSLSKSNVKIFDEVKAGSGEFEIGIHPLGIPMRLSSDAAAAAQLAQPIVNALPSIVDSVLFFNDRILSKEKTPELQWLNSTSHLELRGGEGLDPWIGSGFFSKSMVLEELAELRVDAGFAESSSRAGLWSTFNAPNLRLLVLWGASSPVAEQLQQNAKFGKSLQSLHIGEVTGDKRSFAAAVSSLKLPKVTELTFFYSPLNESELQTILRAPWFKNIQHVRIWVTLPWNAAVQSLIKAVEFHGAKKVKLKTASFSLFPPHSGKDKSDENLEEILKKKIPGFLGFTST